MDRSEYAILAVIAATTVGLGMSTTTQPLGTFLVESVRGALSTTATVVRVTWWAFVASLVIAGDVEAWTSGEEVSELLEGHGPRGIGHGSLFGFVSSSCSYSAIAAAKNLFRKGGSAAAALGALMLASINLVIEIGAVIWVPLGQQSLAADILGGFILIGLMTFGFAYLVPDEVIEQARRNVQDKGSGTARDPACGMEVDSDEAEYSVERDGRTFYFCSESCKESSDPEEADTTVRERATLLSGQKVLAGKQRKEWGMLWDEVAIGFVFTGLIAGFIPDMVWIPVFLGPTSGLLVYVFWTVVLGAVIGVATFVCSVGNIPFGVALFSNGLPLGSVLSYTYTDPIALPIADVYHEYYGMTFAAVLSGTTSVAVALTGVVIRPVFLGAGFIPAPEGVQITEVSIEADYGLVLNVFATGLSGVFYQLHRSEPVGDDGHGGHGEAAQAGD